MCRFRFFTSAAVQTQEVRATLVRSARDAIGDPSVGERGDVIIEIGGHFVVERSECQVLFGNDGGLTMVVYR